MPARAEKLTYEGKEPSHETFSNGFRNFGRGHARFWMFNGPPGQRDQRLDGRIHKKILVVKDFDPFESEQLPNIRFECSEVPRAIALLKYGNHRLALFCGDLDFQFYPFRRKSGRTNNCYRIVVPIS
ncbi:MAG TPA: hypothetical protein VIY49_21085 [Bryobacteraceae bacterium]